MAHISPQGKNLSVLSVVEIIQQEWKRLKERLNITCRFGEEEWFAQTVRVPSYGARGFG